MKERSVLLNSESKNGGRATARKSRIEIIDAVRAVAIIVMLFHHTMYDLKYLFNVDTGFFTYGVQHGMAMIFAPVFMLVAGISSQLSRNNIKRGVFVLLCAMGLTLFTYIFIRSQLILFGILHFMGISMIIYGLINKYLDKLKNFQPVIYVAMFVLSDILIGKINVDYNYLFMFGISGSTFSSADYYPLLPWIFVFFIGTYIGKFIKDRRFPGWFYSVKIPVLSLIGKKSLIIYLAHQPLIYAVLLIVTRVFA